MVKNNKKKGKIRAKKILKGVGPMLEDLAGNGYVTMIRAADMRNGKRNGKGVRLEIVKPITGGLELLAYGKKPEYSQRVYVHGDADEIGNYLHARYA